MASKIKGKTVTTSGKRVLDIPLDQLLPDPHQPRRRFKESELDELAGSIEDQGLQQLPTVNFAYRKGDKSYYYIKAGERRWRVHQRLKKPSMMCFVEEGTYDGVRDVKRRLAQAAENSSRVPHTHSEIVALIEEAVQEAVDELGTKFGAVHIGLGRVAKAFGKSLAWASNYQTLTGLLPELRDMLDEDTDGERLNFSVGTALARAPADVQLDILQESQAHFEKGGHAAGYGFIVRKTRAIRVSRGEKIRGRASDDKDRFMRIVERLLELSNIICGERRSKEYKKYVEEMLGRMSVIEVDETLGNLKPALQTFADLRDMLQAKRTANYKPFSIAARG